MHAIVIEFPRFQGKLHFEQSSCDLRLITTITLREIKLQKERWESAQNGFINELRTND